MPAAAPLPTELHRLFHLTTPDAPGPQWLDAQGRTRTLVLGLMKPADWDCLGLVWRGVQQVLELPAPAIAVSGRDSLQLWFSLAEPVDTPQAQAFLQALCRHFAPEVPARRWQLWPSPATPEAPARHADPVPACVVPPDQWSAFVAPDLAPIFADTPWLDMAPGEDGQAKLLSPLRSIRPEQLAAALAVLQAAARPPAAESGPAAAAPTPALPEAVAPQIASTPDPRSFLLAVMNDASVPLALRIEAAKALLPTGAGPQR